MFVWLGNVTTGSPEALRKFHKIHSEASPKPESYHSDRVLVIAGNGYRGKNRIFKDDSEYVLVVEGDVFLRSYDFPKDKGSAILSVYKKYGSEITSHLGGIFNLVIWDKNRNQALIANDKTGLDPLYYSIDNGGDLIVSDKMDNIINVGLLERNVDEIGLMELASLNYVLGKRTLMRGVSRLLPATRISWSDGKMEETSYWSSFTYMKQPASDPHSLLDKISQTFCEVVADWATGKDKVGILLSGGYDSRAILACLHKLGVPGHAYTWKNGHVEDLATAAELASNVGYVHKDITAHFECQDIDERMHETCSISDYNFPLFHIGRYCAIDSLADEVDVVFSGQGELIRATAIPNDYINSVTADALHHGYVNLNSNRPHFFDFETLDRIDAVSFDHGELPETLSMSEKLTWYLVNIAYRNDYGILRFVESSRTPVAMPFLDPRIIESLFSSPYSISRLKSWRRDISATMNGRKIYYHIIRNNAPALLKIDLDRGYPLGWDSGIKGFLATGASGLWNSVSSKKIRRTPNTSPWKRFVHDRLQEAIALDIPYLNKSKITESLAGGALWKPEVGYELEKVARFSLWYRHFIREGGREKR